MKPSLLLKTKKFKMDVDSVAVAAAPAPWITLHFLGIALNVTINHYYWPLTDRSICGNAGGGRRVHTKY